MKKKFLLNADDSFGCVIWTKGHRCLDQTVPPCQYELYGNTNYGDVRHKYIVIEFNLYLSSAVFDRHNFVFIVHKYIITRDRHYFYRKNLRNEKKMVNQKTNFFVGAYLSS